MTEEKKVNFVSVAEIPAQTSQSIPNSTLTSKTKLRGRRHDEEELDGKLKSVPKAEAAKAALDDLLLDKKKALEQSDKRRKSVTGTDPKITNTEDLEPDEFEEEKENKSKLQARKTLYRCIVFINAINFCRVFGAAMKRSIYYMPLERFWNFHFHSCQQHEMKRPDDDTLAWFILELYNVFLYGFCSLFLMWCGHRRTLDFIFLYFKLHVIAAFANSFVGWQHIRLNGANWDVVKSEISWFMLRNFWDIFVASMYIIYCYYISDFETIWARQIPMRSKREMNAEIDLKFMEDITVMKNAFKWSGRHQAIKHIRKYMNKYGQPFPGKGDKISYDLDEGIYEFRQHHRIPYLRIHRAQTGLELMRAKYFRDEEEQVSVIQRSNKPVFETGKKRGGKNKPLKIVKPKISKAATPLAQPARTSGMSRQHAELLNAKNPNLRIEDLLKQQAHTRLLEPQKQKKKE